jgi:hypothetical protein
MSIGISIDTSWVRSHLSYRASFGQSRIVSFQFFQFTRERWLSRVFTQVRVTLHSLVGRRAGRILDSLREYRTAFVVVYRNLKVTEFLDAQLSVGLKRQRLLVGWHRDSGTMPNWVSQPF